MTGPYRLDRPNHPPEWFPTEDAALAAEARMRRDGARDVVAWRDDAVYEAYVDARGCARRRREGHDGTRGRPEVVGPKWIDPRG